MPEYIKGAFRFVAPSRRKTKKYDVYDRKTGEFIVSFGGVRPNGEPYEHYNDSIGYYKKWNHGSKTRKRNWYARHCPHTDKKRSAAWFSAVYLW